MNGYFSNLKICFFFLNELGLICFYKAISKMSCSFCFLLDYIAVRKLFFFSERPGMAADCLEIAATGGISRDFWNPKVSLNSLYLLKDNSCSEITTI